MTPARTALLVLLASTLAVVSCATALEKHSRPEVVVQPVPLPPFDPLAARALLIPVKGVSRATLRDNYYDKRGKRSHQALDIMAKRGTPVLAADDGRIAKVYRHPLGGLSVYQYDPDAAFAYYYAHLDAYGKAVAEGAMLRRGDVVGYVGTSGNASPTAPHLHFAILRLGAEKKWYKGTPVNPFPYLNDVEPATR
jgi:peptidoglycan LD-endopeptidase LytH